MKTNNLKNETIYFFRSQRNTEHNHGFYNASKFFVGTVNKISLKDISIVPFVGVIDDAGNRLDITAKEIHDFEKGKSQRLVLDWDGIYDTSYYIRESGLTQEEKEMTNII